MPKDSPGRDRAAAYVRGLIQDGKLPPDSQVPSIRAIADEVGVSRQTAQDAVQLLAGAGWVHRDGDRNAYLVSASQPGSQRAGWITRTPGERTRPPWPPVPAEGDAVTVTAAASVAAPDYVADLLALDPGADKREVIRREEVITRDGRPYMLTVDWIPAPNVLLVAELTGPVPIEGGPEAAIRRHTGRRVTQGADYLRGRAADKREAGHLGLPAGSPILAGAHIWSDDEGPLLYGEWCMPPDQVVMYPYDDLPVNPAGD
jgi:GntR family transcriptional regulator